MQYTLTPNRAALLARAEALPLSPTAQRLLKFASESELSAINSAKEINDVLAARLRSRETRQNAGKPKTNSNSLSIPTQVAQIMLDGKVHTYREFGATMPVQAVTQALCDLKRKGIAKNISKGDWQATDMPALKQYVQQRLEKAAKMPAPTRKPSPKPLIEVADSGSRLIHLDAPLTKKTVASPKAVRGMLALLADGEPHGLKDMRRAFPRHHNQLQWVLKTLREANVISIVSRGVYQLVNLAALHEYAESRSISLNADAAPTALVAQSEDTIDAPTQAVTEIQAQLEEAPHQCQATDTIELLKRSLTLLTLAESLQRLSPEAANQLIGTVSMLGQQPQRRLRK